MVIEFDRRLAAGSAERLREKRQVLSPLAIPPGRGWEPAHEAMHAILREPPGTIGGVIDRLQAVGSLLDTLPPSPANNRVACFNHLYLKITKRVDDALTSDAAAPEFLELLDVEFARRYFQALDLWNQDDDTTPDVWEVLFKRARDERMTTLVAAVLGVNAHINHDLALALIDTWRETGAPGSEVHPDYLLVNKIFYEEIPPLRQSFSTEWQLAIDGFVGPLDDWSQRILVTVTRARAWDQGRRLWDLQADADDFDQARLTMDRAASLIGEWLIVSDRFLTASGEVTERGRRLLRRVLRDEYQRDENRREATGRTQTGRTGAGRTGAGLAGTRLAGTGPAGTGPAGTGPAGTGPAGTGPAETDGGETVPGAVERDPRKPVYQPDDTIER